MKKPMIVTIVLLVVVFGGLLAFNFVRSYFIHQFEKNFKPPPIAVSTAKAKSQSWQPVLKATGSLAAINGVEVSSELAGKVVAILFHSGDTVQKGQPLIQLDDSTDQEDLKNNQAELNLDKLTYERMKKLYRTRAVAKSDYDEALAKLQQARAAVAKTEVIISKKNIKAPFAGKIGIRQVNLGQYVNPGDALVSLQSLNPLYINFSLPEQYLKDVHLKQKIAIRIDGYPNEYFYGKLTAINAEVTQTTRNINLQATINNEQGKLYPGGFADVEVFLPIEKSVVTVPQTAVTYSLYGNTVYVVDMKKKQAFQHYVEVGDMRNNVVVIKKGVKVGDEVVTSGQNRLQEGTDITINNSLQLKPLKPQLLTGP